MYSTSKYDRVGSGGGEGSVPPTDNKFFDLQFVFSYHSTVRAGLSMSDIPLIAYLGVVEHEAYDARGQHVPDPGWRHPPQHLQRQMQRHEGARRPERKKAESTSYHRITTTTHKGHDAKGVGAIIINLCRSEGKY